MATARPSRRLQSAHWVTAPQNLSTRAAPIRISLTRRSSERAIYDRLRCRTNAELVPLGSRKLTDEQLGLGSDVGVQAQSKNFAQGFRMTPTRRTFLQQPSPTVRRTVGSYAARSRPCSSLAATLLNEQGWNRDAIDWSGPQPREHVELEAAHDLVRMTPHPPCRERSEPLPGNRLEGVLDALDRGDLGRLALLPGVDTGGDLSARLLAFCARGGERNIRIDAE